jgi:hypothetical protein
MTPCSAVDFSTFQMNVLPPSSGSKNKPNKQQAARGLPVSDTGLEMVPIGATRKETSDGPEKGRICRSGKFRKSGGKWLELCLLALPCDSEDGSGASGISVNLTRTTRRHISHDGTLNSHRCEILKFCLILRWAPAAGVVRHLTVPLDKENQN